MFLVIYSQISLNVSVNLCETVCPAQAWLIMLLMLLAEVVLAIRTWAIWQRNIFVGIALTALISSVFITECVWLKEFTNSFQYAPAPYRRFRGCFITNVSKTLWKDYIALTVFEFAVLFLVALGAYQSYKLGKVSRLLHIVYRDGILFYIYLLLLTIANVATTTLLPLDLTTMLSPLETCLYSVLTTRIVLNTRDEGSRGIQA